MSNDKPLVRRDTAEAAPSTGSGQVVPHETGLAEPEYEALRDKCAGIIQAAQQNLVVAMWEVGREIVAAIGSQRQEWGAQIVHRLSQDLAMDHTRVFRAIQLYETYPQKQLSRGAATILGPHLTWEKAKMLLPLPPALRAEMEKRLAAGEIRTDDDLRLAIYERKVALGLIDQDFTQPRALGVVGIDAEKMRTLLRKAGPDARLVFGLTTTWEEDWIRYYIRADVPEERRVAAKEALGEKIARMQRAYEEL